MLRIRKLISYPSIASKRFLLISLRRFSKFNGNSQIAVIGGGMSGLSALKELKQVGFNDVTLFEFSNDIGGNWDPNNQITAGYNGMISNSSHKVWPFSDYMYDWKKYSKCIDDYPEMASLPQVHDHLSNYAKYFNLYDNIKLNSNVTQVTQNTQTAKWDVTINKRLQSFDRIVICCGTASYPSYPKHININDFRNNFNGNIYHSANIKQIESFDDKNILIIGNSFSSCDIAEHSCINKAKCVYNVYREPRLILNLWETENKDTNIEDSTVDVYLMRRNKLFDFNPVEFAFYLDDYGFITPDLNNINPETFKFAPCKHGFQHFCKEGILKGIHGEVEDVNGDNVYLKDGTVLNDIDIIIFATGFDVNGVYKNILPIEINNKMYQPNIKESRHLLYLLTFIAGYETDCISFVGANAVLGAITYELQSRLIAQVWSNNVKLPSVDVQNQWIKDKIIDYDPLWFITQVPALPYLDEIADYIGVLPQKRDYPLEYQYIYDQLQNDVFYPPQFRIIGPGTNEDIKMKSLELLSEIIKTECKESKKMQAITSQIPFNNLVL